MGGWIQYSELLYCAICEPVLDFWQVNLFSNRYLSNNKCVSAGEILFKGLTNGFSGATVLFFYYFVFLSMKRILRNGNLTLDSRRLFENEIPETTISVVQAASLSEKLNQKKVTEPNKYLGFQREDKHEKERLKLAERYSQMFRGRYML